MNIISSIQYKPRLATCQADVADNIRRAEPLLGISANLGSTFVCFPELAFTGYSFLNRSEAEAVSEPMFGPTYVKMSQFARQSQSYVIYGYVERNGDRLHNACIIINPIGELISNYRKINLWGNDFLWATPGASAPSIIPTPYGLISAVICRDIKSKIPQNINKVASEPFFPTEKPEILFLCANWGKGGFPATPWMDYSLNNECTVVVSNRYGIECNKDFENDFGQGGSLIIQPNWTVHTNGLVFNADCIVTAALEE
jgi:predicted amidohydrolase